MYIFAVATLTGVASYIGTAPAGDPVSYDLIVFFKSLPMALLSFFMAVTDGVSWWQIEKLLLNISVGDGLIFVLFITIMVLIVMNIITSIFVNDALERAKMDKELISQVEMKKE